jgi:hypothetical protein
VEAKGPGTRVNIADIKIKLQHKYISKLKKVLKKIFVHSLHNIHEVESR